MKKATLIFSMLLLMSCSSVYLVDTWKNPEIDSYEPYKVLVVGITSNTEARKMFENQFKEQLQLRGVETVASINLFDSSFGTEKITENELMALEDSLVHEGFDTILLSKVIGVEDKIVYKENYDGYDETYKKFTEEYLMYQDVFYNPDYYKEYTVYHVETNMYCLCPAKDRELIWKGYIDIVDPQFIDETINDYVQLVTIVLEEQQLISPQATLNNSPEEPLIN